MPLKGNSVYCINHPDKIMTRDNIMHAITVIQSDGKGNISFNPASGVPCVVYVCDICGYLESYLAMKTPYWSSFKGSPENK